MKIITIYSWDIEHLHSYAYPGGCNRLNNKLNQTMRLLLTDCLSPAMSCLEKWPTCHAIVPQGGAKVRRRKGFTALVDEDA